MGWDEINNIKEQHKLKESSFNRLSCSIFLQEPGKEFLQLLKDDYLLSPVASPNESASMAYYREGQNSLVRRIMRAIEMKDQGSIKNESK